MDFNSYEDVERWLDIPGNSVDKLREHVAAGTMSARKARWAHNWLRRYDEGIAQGQAEREFALQERNVRAAERSADAAERAAWAAAIAVGISLVALGVAIGEAITRTATGGH